MLRVFAIMSAVLIICGCDVDTISEAALTHQNTTPRKLHKTDDIALIIDKIRLSAQSTMDRDSINAMSPGLLSGLDSIPVLFVADLEYKDLENLKNSDYYNITTIMWSDNIDWWVLIGDYLDPESNTEKRISVSLSPFFSTPLIKISTTPF